MKSGKNVRDIPFDLLAEEAPAIRERINKFRRSLGRFFVGKQETIDLMTLCAVAQEPLLLVGPPGTAKSDLVLKFKDALGLTEEDYFEYMLTRFTEPSEVMGPIDINLLRDGHYIRRVDGKIPTAKLVFLDEIFKSNSAILNSLLTIINEKKYYQDGSPKPVALKILFAATNEIPEQAELGALKDRFCLKMACRSVQDDYFLELIDAGLTAHIHKELQQKPWAENHATLEDFLKANVYLTRLLAKKTINDDGSEKSDRDLFFSAELLREMRRILKTLVREDGVFVSDRKIIKLYRLIRTNAWLHRGGVVERQDLSLLRYLGETKDEIELLDAKVPKLLGLS